MEGVCSIIKLTRGQYSVACTATGMFLGAWGGGDLRTLKKPTQPQLRINRRVVGLKVVVLPTFHFINNIFRVIISLLVHSK